MAPQYLPACYYSAPVMQVAAAPPYNAPAHNASIYNNPTFQSPQFQAASRFNDSAIVSSEHYADEDYYHVDSGMHQPTLIEPDISFGNEDFDRWRGPY